MTGALIGNTDDDLRLVSHGWADELRNFGPTPDAIKHALNNMPADRPPNLLQFKELCRNGLKSMPKPPAIERKYSPEELAENRKRVKELLNNLQRKTV